METTNQKLSLKRYAPLRIYGSKSKLSLTCQFPSINFYPYFERKDK